METITLSDRLTNNQKIEIMKIAVTTIKNSATTSIENSIKFYNQMVEAIEG